MREAPAADAAKLEREALGVALTDLNTVSRKSVADDGQIFFGATSALELAVESLFPPHADAALAAQSCREALKLVKLTRAYASRDSGGANAKLLEQATASIEQVLKKLRA
jgi:hypothetical protein